MKKLIKSGIDYFFDALIEHLPRVYEKAQACEAEDKKQREEDRKKSLAGKIQALKDKKLTKEEKRTVYLNKQTAEKLQNRDLSDYEKGQLVELENDIADLNRRLSGLGKFGTDYSEY